MSSVSTMFPLLLRSDHKILRNESCSGYMDIFGIWNTGFYCPQSDSKSAVYCCGTDTYKYCCTTKNSNEEITSDELPISSITIRTPVIIGALAGFIIITAFIILAICFVCPCCFFYKKRTAHIPRGLYRIQCGTSSTTSALVNLHSPFSSGNMSTENNNLWSPRPPELFTTMVPPSNHFRGIIPSLISNSTLPPHSSHFAMSSSQQINNLNMNRFHPNPQTSYLNNLSTNWNSNLNRNAETHLRDPQNISITTNSGATGSSVPPNFHRVLGVGTSNPSRRNTQSPYYNLLQQKQQQNNHQNINSRDNVDNGSPQSLAPAHPETNFPSCASSSALSRQQTSEIDFNSSSTSPMPSSSSTSTNEHLMGEGNRPKTFISNHTNISPQRFHSETTPFSSPCSRSLIHLGERSSGEFAQIYPLHRLDIVRNVSKTDSNLPTISSSRFQELTLTNKPEPLLKSMTSHYSSESSRNPHQFNSLSRIARILQSNGNDTHNIQYFPTTRTSPKL